MLTMCIFLICSLSSVLAENAELQNWHICLTAIWRLSTCLNTSDLSFLLYPQSMHSHHFIPIGSLSFLILAITRLSNSKSGNQKKEAGSLIMDSWSLAARIEGSPCLDLTWVLSSQRLARMAGQRLHDKDRWRCLLSTCFRTSFLSFCW